MEPLPLAGGRRPRYHLDPRRPRGNHRGGVDRRPAGQTQALRLTPSEIRLAASAYLAGAVLGATIFGWLTDRLGRKRLFNITLGVYLVATTASAFAWDFWSFVLFRFLTGAGIGGEYTAINSAIRS